MGFRISYGAGKGSWDRMKPGPGSVPDSAMPIISMIVPGIRRWRLPSSWHGVSGAEVQPTHTFENDIDIKS